MATTATQSHRYRVLAPGDPAPWFHQRSTSNERYAFDTTAGRYIVLCFYGTAADPRARAALAAVDANRRVFDDKRVCFFGVSLDPHDEREHRVKESMPGIRFFWDFDGQISKLYGVAPTDATPGEKSMRLRRSWVVLGPTLRVLAIFPLDEGDHSAVFTYLDSLAPPERFAGIEVQAPVLILPNVFEPEFCRELIALYEAQGGEETGFMREVDGKTVQAYDHGRKRRKDIVISDSTVIEQTQYRVRRRIKPEIMKVHQFDANRMERYIVGCYTAEDGGHFAAHRDNTTKGTAHRRFAVSINLNEEFTGGELNFPEYGPRTYKMPTGGAVVFSCSLLHAVSKVTSGRRYAFLPFLYDDAAAKIREANNAYLGEGVGEYRPT
jgi:peroxiredoxin/predicted 2-oxoglutarate/Fe(II)-dependent dioxygenase YbiX